MDGLQPPDLYLLAAEERAAALAELFRRLPEAIGKTDRELSDMKLPELVGLPSTTGTQKRWARRMALRKEK